VNVERLSPGRIAVVVTFALSCFAIALYFWSTFGGSIPLRPKGYRISVPLKSGLILPTNAPVRIAGVDVGRTTGHSPLPGGRWLVTVELDAPYAPLPADARAIVRSKTFFGETYLELTPGTRGGAALPDGGRLPWASVRAPVELEEIFRAFDAPTRRALQRWLDQQGTSIDVRGRDLGDAFATLPAFEEQMTALARWLNDQAGAVRRLVADTGAVFAALAERDGQLRALVDNGERATGAFAARGDALAAAVRALPAFEAESARTNRALARFAMRADPVVTDLRPAAGELSPALQDVAALAPELDGFLRALGPAVDAARAGLPATARFVGDLGGLLGEFPPFLVQLNPLLRAIGTSDDELDAVLGNWTAATQFAPAGLSGRPTHVLRLTTPLGPEPLAPYARRIGSNRSNPYATPGARADLTRRYEVFDARACGNGTPRLTVDGGGTISEDLLARVRRFAFGGDGSVAAPSCLTARPRGPTRYPATVADAP
jgi:phospholipid/cholesterol/gamma-HCH transport system substrate-binding protein